MTLRVVGAGVGRTGTHSLKVALEQLLGGPCYHMVEVLQAPERATAWVDAANGSMPDWAEVFDGYVATVDWPGASFWPELVEAYPDAMVLLSTRESVDVWHRSADATIFEAMRRRGDAPPELGDAPNVGTEVIGRRFAPVDSDRNTLIAAYERHNAAVRADIPADRLVEWQPADGWGPLCAMLGVPEPDEPFPVTNTTDEFRAMLGL